MPYAAQLRDAVGGLNEPYGAERSIKLKAGALLQERFLLSLHKSAFGEDAASGVHRFIAPFRMPERYRQAVMGSLPDVEIIHVGCESDGSSELLKLYLEFPFDADTCDSVVVHRAYKWDAINPENRALTEYRYQPGIGRAGIVKRVGELFASNDRAPSVFVRQMIEKSERDIPADELLMLEVTEEGNPRSSFDLKFYDAEWTLISLETELAALFSHFQLPQALHQRLMQQCGDRILGHLSGGIGRDGAEFITLYFGVEEHG